MAAGFDAPSPLGLVHRLGGVSAAGFRSPVTIGLLGFLGSSGAAAAPRTGGPILGAEAFALWLAEQLSPPTAPVTPEIEPPARKSARKAKRRLKPPPVDLEAIAFHELPESVRDTARAAVSAALDEASDCVAGSIIRLAHARYEQELILRAEEARKARIRRQNEALVVLLAA